MHDAKTHLSRYLAQLREGERILLCRRNVPVAEIRPLSRRPRKPARPGRWRGRIEIPDSFFEPLPDGMLDAFEGHPGADA